MKQIIVTIEDNGQVRIDALGFRGNACEKATAVIESALGKADKKGRKPEYFQTKGQTVAQGH